MFSEQARQDEAFDPYKIQREAQERADIEFTKVEAKGDWSEWTPKDANTIPPWWNAGAEYVWEIMQARTRIALSVGQDEGSIRVLWRRLIPGVALSLWDRLRRYEPELNEIPADLNRPTPRQGGFLKYVERELYPKLAGLLLRPEKVAAVDNEPRSQPAKSAKKAEPKFPARAIWLKDRLRERAWDKNDLGRQGGPDRKTGQKILDGFKVRLDVLEKVAKALSTKVAKVSVDDIPWD